MTRMPARWSLGKRIAFRFGFLVAVLQIVPFPLGLIPGTWRLRALVYQLWDCGVVWTARVILGIPAPSQINHGSGDTTWHYVQLLLIGILAVAGTLAWSILDRKRASYARLAGTAIVVLRYFLAMMLLHYGFAKVFAIQFVDLSPTRLDQRVGDMSPMGMLWSFMGSSRAYTMFGGWMEVVPGLLLLWRRTSMLGALAAIAVLTNIVMMNFSYDVPVKLFSLQLLVYSIAIAAPQSMRLLAAALGYRVEELPLRVRMTPSWERVRWIVKLVIIGSMVLGLTQFVDRARDWRPPPTPLHGIWQVESFVADGVERPPLLTDPVRWRKLIVSRGFVTIREMADTRVHHPAQIDATTIRVQRGLIDEVWSYTRVEDQLVLEGRHRGHELRVTLRLEPEPLLTSRGFHWINDEPFNR
ncbi:MAG: hypothetical protein H0T42_01955 [Deltaproteobacteria bacterium]|nr:hypothetical protein [Deltaproteobacteria bacterium]